MYFASSGWFHTGFSQSSQSQVDKFNTVTEIHTDSQTLADE